MTIKKRYLIVTLLLALLLIGYSQRGPILLKVLPNALTTLMSANGIDDLGPGLHVGLCGAGGPMPSADRSGPCVAVIAGGKLFLVDTGTNGARNILRMGLDLGAVEGVFLTHFHSDHIDGLGETAMLRWIGGSHTDPMPVYGPKGVAEVVDAFNQAYNLDASYRTAHHGTTVASPTGSGMTAVTFDIPQNDGSLTIYDKDDLKVDMIRVDHAPIAPAVAYLFTYKGRTVLVSGDTVKSPNIEKFSQGIDLLLHEALSPQLLQMMSAGAKNANALSRAKIFHDVLDYHTSPVEAAEIARDAKVGHLLYYHVVPPLDIPGMDAIWLNGVDDVFSDYTLGQDGTLFTLPVNSAKIVRVQSKLAN